MPTKWKKWLKMLVVAAALAVVLLLAGILLIALFNPYLNGEKTALLVKEMLESQAKIEENIRNYFKSAKFTFEQPLVVQDPYGRAPLTALALFDTPEKAQIAVHVPGQSPESAVDFAFEGYYTHHEIPIYGLLAGKTNRVQLSLRTESGVTSQMVLEVLTEPLPAYLLNLSADKVNRSKYSAGFNFTFEEHKTVFDIDGAVRWFAPQSSFQVFTPLKNGRYLYTYSADNENLIMEQDLLGKIYSIYNLLDGVHHDIIELPSGNLLVTSADRKSGIKEDILYELDRSSGHIVRTIDFKQILDQNRPHEIGYADNDWLHLNSIFYDEADDSIIISSRAQSAVVKLSYPEMSIKWILGTHENWGEKFAPYLLTPTGEDFAWPWSQHHATVVEEIPGKDRKIVLQLFDNGLYRSFDAAKAFSPAESYSRMVQYEINEAARTIKQVWEYGKNRGSEIFAHSASSAYLLNNGNILGTWGNITKDAEGRPMVKNSGGAKWESKIIEVDPSNNEVVFESTLSVMLNYRSFRASFYERYDEGHDLLSKRVNDTSDLDLIDRVQMLQQDIKNTQDPVILFFKRLVRSVLD